MKTLRTTFLLLALAVTASSFGQIATGYYRVKNKKTDRYLMAIDNQGSVDIMAQKADIRALISEKGFDKVVSNAASIVYISHHGGTQYNLEGQGLSLQALFNAWIDIKPSGDAYEASGTASKGGVSMTLYLWDYSDTAGDLAYPITSNPLGASSSDYSYRKWYIEPIDLSDNSYFGVKPDVEMADGEYYTTLYVSFPYSFPTTDMEAWKITKVDSEMGIAVYAKIENEIIPAATPVIIKSKSNDVASNKLKIVDASTTALADNQLKGVYFCYYRNANKAHWNRTEYDANTMRILGKLSDGSLGFVKGTKENLPYPNTADCDYNEVNNRNGGDGDKLWLRANKAYLPVASGSADNFKLMTQEEYDAVASISSVSVDMQHASGIYNLLGNKLESLEGQPAGIYVVDGKKVVLK